MKKTIMTLAAVFCCTMFVAVICTSCSSDEESDVYSFGFNSYGYAVIGGNPNEIVKQETTWISTAFNDAIKQELGITVSNSQFRYDGSVDKVKAACEKAKAELANKTFQGHYVYVLTNKRTTVYTWEI